MTVSPLPARRRFSWRAAALGVAAAGALGSLAILGRSLSVTEWVSVAVERARGLGPWGPVIYGLAYAPAALLMLPSWPLTMGAGLAFGPLSGALVGAVGNACGATAAFALARFLARGPVERLAAGSARFAALEAAIARSGFRAVLLLRLSPVMPFWLLNYLLGVTRLRLRDFAAASLLGTLPTAAGWAWAGSLVATAAEIWTAGRSARSWGWAVAALAVTVAVSWGAVRVVKRALPRDLLTSR